MKLKKKVKAKGGAQIADRLKIDNGSGKSQPVAGAVGRRSATYALVFGCIALAVVGILTYTLYKHWEFLMPA